MHALSKLESDLPAILASLSSPAKLHTVLLFLPLEDFIFRLFTVVFDFCLYTLHIQLHPFFLCQILVKQGQNLFNITAIFVHAKWRNCTIFDNQKTPVVKVIFSVVFFNKGANVSTHVGDPSTTVGVGVPNLPKSKGRKSK